MTTKVKIKTTMGDIVLALADEQVPTTVENFLDYVKTGYYKDTIFHRVIDGFMIQGGGLEADLSDKPAKNPIENEAAQGLSNKAGTIAMARTNDPHSASSQFFINLEDNNFLNFTAESFEGYGYCAFGEVIEGMTTVSTIGKSTTTSKQGYDDVPVEEILIEDMVILDE